MYSDVKLMNRYEKLMNNNQHLYIYDNYKLSGDFKGVYSEGVIAIDKDVNSINKLELLAEELSHHKLTYGNILDQTIFINRKFEGYARRDAMENMVTLQDIIDAYKNGCHNLYTIAEFLSLSESYVQDSIVHYKRKYGLATRCGDYLLQFEPLRVFEYKKIYKGDM